MDKSLLELYDDMQNPLTTDEPAITPQGSDETESLQTLNESGIAPSVPENDTEGLDIRPDLTAKKVPEPDKVCDDPCLPTEQKPDTERLTAVLNEALGKLESKILQAQESMTRIEPIVSAIAANMRGYDDAVKQLRISLAANQRNEEVLYNRLDAAKKDEHFTTVRPFLEFMVLQHMDLTRSKQNYEKDQDVIVEESGEEIFREIMNLHENQLVSLENQLSIQGVEIVSYLPGTAYLPLEQNIIGFTPTENPEEERTVSAAKSFTYKYNGKVLRKANVTCYKLNG